MTNTLSVRLKGDVSVVVPNNLGLITPFVLLEQEDWFESELEFVRRALEPGMIVIDVGANYGVFTMAMAKAVGSSGKVIAYEPTPDVAQLLSQSVSDNGFSNVQVQRIALSNKPGIAHFAVGAQSELNRLVSERPRDGNTIEVKLDLLDHQLESLRIGFPDFVKIDAEGHGAEVVSGASRIFIEGDPLVLFEINDGTGSLDLDLVKRFENMGYSAYRLLPCAQFLVPFDPQAPIDAYSLNVFVAKPSRVQRLAQCGLLAEPTVNLAGERNSWSQYAQSLPYAKRAHAQWLRAPKLFAKAADKKYFRALERFAHAQSPNCSAWVRFTALSEAKALALEAVRAEPSLQKLMTVIRLDYELGSRGIAVTMLKNIVPVVMSREFSITKEPFLAPIPRFDTVEWDGQDQEWVVAAILEPLVKLGFWSDFYSRGVTTEWLERLAQSHYASVEMERRLQLQRMLNGLPKTSQTRNRVSEHSAENLNADLWSKRSPFLVSA